MKIPRMQVEMSAAEMITSYVRFFQKRKGSRVTLTDEEFRHFVDLYQKPGTMLGAEVREPIFRILEDRSSMEDLSHEFSR